MLSIIVQYITLTWTTTTQVIPISNMSKIQKIIGRELPAPEANIFPNSVEIWVRDLVLLSNK